MICGIDEAGRGPVMGPMVVAAVWLEKSDEQQLVKMGVRDSKKLSANHREYLAHDIMQNWMFDVTVVEAHDIDLFRKTMTLNDLEVYLFAALARKRKASIYYIDAASSNEAAFKASIRKNIGPDGDLVCEHKADDRYPVVSAASIVAKVERDKRLALIARELEEKLELPLGSGYPSDEKTISFIRTWFATHGTLPPHTRKSWKTISHIIGKMNQHMLF